MRPKMTPTPTTYGISVQYNKVVGLSMTVLEVFIMIHNADNIGTVLKYDAVGWCSGAV